MDCEYSIFRYTTQLVHDNKEGNSAVELHATRKGESAKRVARVVFWDAYGDFFFESYGAQVPIVIVEQLVAEAKMKIKIRYGRQT
jgi:hypothetical protein